MTKWHAGRKEAEAEKSHGIIRDGKTLAGKPLPCGDTQITRSGLN